MRYPLNTRGRVFQLVLLTVILPITCLATSVEIDGPDAVVTPTMTSGAPLGGAYINPTGIQVGNDLFLYVQGGNLQQGPAGDGQSVCTGTGGDQIHLFTAPHTLIGATSPFTYARRITPCEKIPGTSVNWSWGPGQIFDDGAYRIVADKSDQRDFRQWALGSSTDGLNWTWQDFAVSTLSTLEIYAPVLRPTSSSCYCDPTCYCHSFWEGFFPMNSPGWGTGRLKVDASDKYPRGFRIKILDTAGTWRTLNDTTGEINFTPMNVWSYAGVRSLVYNNGTWELWAYKNVPNNGCHGCGSGPYTSGSVGTTFVYRTVDSQWNLGSVQEVFSMQRCMPSDNIVGRLHPFRYNGIPGAKLLFSTTNDANMCRDGVIHTYVGTYIVATEVDN